MLNLFGERVASGSRDIAWLIRKHIEAGNLPDVARALAFFDFEPTATLMLQHADACEDEKSHLLFHWAVNHHAVFETIARSKRKQVQDAMISAKHPSEWRIGWLAEYYKTEHWAETRAFAYGINNTPDSCLLCGNDRDDWHHPHYDAIGTDEDFRVIVPLCSQHHTMVHVRGVGLPEIKCGTMPQRIRDIIDRDQ